MDLKKLISQMTLEEKASFCSGKDFWQSMDLERLGIPSIFLADGPHGIRKQKMSADHLGLNESLKATCYPPAATMANSWDTALGEEMGILLGKEAVAQKVNVLLGPGINIKRSPLCGRNFEYFSEDPYLAGKMGAAYVKGIQSNGISACLKHFAANNQEERRMVIDSVMDERTLREIYLTAFEIAVKEGQVKSIMSSYNKINGDYTNENEHLLKEILRDGWGYQGLIVTDWGGNNDRIKALSAGSDLEMPTTGGQTNKEIIDAVKSGVIKESVLDDTLERLLKLIFETEVVFVKKQQDFEVDDHHDSARRAAEESIVLLKNDEVLPLKKESKIAIIGDFAKKPRFQGAGSSIVNPTKLDNTLEKIKEYDLNYVGYEPGFNRFGKKRKSLLKKAAKLANEAEIVLLYLGLDEVTEMEGLDRKNIKLPANQIKLLETLHKTGKKIVAVLSAGSAIEMDWTNKVDAVIHAYLGGQAGATAILNAITGIVNPSGKLAESYPINHLSCSSNTNFPGGPATVEYREALFIGYRYYDTANIDVKYPFGFGLSYTTFRYSDLKLTDNGVTFNLENIGKMTGAEIAQLYVRLKNSKIFRPKKELKGFIKVKLEPNESKIAEILFDEYTFRYFNVKTNKWEIESGEYEIIISASSADRDIKLITTLTVIGTEAELPYVAEDLPSYFSGNVHDVSNIEFEKLLNRKIPDANLEFIRKKRINVDYNTPVSDLKYACGWTGRLFALMLRFIIKIRGNSVMLLGAYQMPMRGISRMTGGAISWEQLNGLILMFNGHFSKGLHKFLKEGRKKKKLKKAKKKLEKLNNKEILQNSFPLTATDEMATKKRFRKWFSNIQLAKSCARFSRKFKKKHPRSAQFFVFLIISCGVTVLQLILMPVLNIIFESTSLIDTDFQILQIGKNFDGTNYYVFDYAKGTLGAGGGGLAYFLAVQITLAIAQIINFFAQRNITFKAKGSILWAAMWYFIAYLIITIGAAALQGLYKAPFYNLLINTWGWGETGKTVANVITMNIVSTISFLVFFPIFKFIFKQKNQTKNC